ncbi:MAG: radical SAM protein [Vampirovibrionales bacterium]|nr:radical SAM protein [Vampirovibrionales bacterium]
MPRATVRDPLAGAHETFLYTPAPPRPDAVGVALAYPADYGVAMASLGYLTLFRLLDQRPDVAAQRVTMDALRAGRRLHPQTALLGFSFSFELDILNILKTLELCGIPLRACDRDASHPLVFAGGPVAMTNGEPYADFIDFYLIGDGEEAIGDLIDAWHREAARAGGDRQGLLRRLAQTVPGLYAPALYEVTYAAPDGPVTAITPRFDDVPPVVAKRSLSAAFADVAFSPILTPESYFSSVFLVEVMRGCAHRCRFCMASYATLPPRASDAGALMRAVETGLRHTPKIGLLGALIANHPEFEALCEFLNHQMNAHPDLTLSAASLRADTLTPAMVETFVRGKQRQLTIAIETGSQRLRQRINKRLSEEEIARAAEICARAGLPALKLYGMVGLPDETDDDIEDTIRLIRQLRRDNPRLDLVFGCSSFVPKGATPFQWAPRLDTPQVEKRFERLRRGLVGSAAFRPSSARWDAAQALLSRGDRRLSGFLLRYAAYGGSLGHIRRAMKDGAPGETPSIDWYALRQRPPEETLPWQVVSLGVPNDILYREGQSNA